MLSCAKEVVGDPGMQDASRILASSDWGMFTQVECAYWLLVIFFLSNGREPT